MSARAIVCVCVQKNISNNVPNLQLKVETTNGILAHEKNREREREYMCVIANAECERNNRIKVNKRELLAIGVCATNQPRSYFKSLTQTHNTDTDTDKCTVIDVRPRFGCSTS